MSLTCLFQTTRLTESFKTLNGIRHFNIIEVKNAEEKSNFNSNTNTLPNLNWAFYHIRHYIFQDGRTNVVVACNIFLDRVGSKQRYIGNTKETKQSEFDPYQENNKRSVQNHLKINGE